MSESRSLSSVEKKRLRDRRAQQALRDKKLQYTSQLEDKVAHCERYHDDSAAQHLLQVIEGLQRQNEVLQRRQEGLKALVQGWEEGTDTVHDDHSHNHDHSRLDSTSTPYRQPTLPPQPPIPHSPIHTALPELPLPLPVTTTGDSPIPNTHTHTDSSKPPPPPHPHPHPHPQPLSTLLPLHSDHGTLLYLSNRSMIIASPPSPSPLDLLYGTKSNPLANAIYTFSLHRPLRDPERLAFGWLSYHYAKWLTSPSPTTFIKLAPFMRPTPEQLTIPHPASLDLIIWPALRGNLIREWGAYARQKDDLFGILACCIRVRWPWGRSVLERDERNELVIRGEFLETFMRLDGWGITREFVRCYPTVLKGIDVGGILHEVL
ncbi:hypothetical protein BO70DRAFT_217892 [Aspergillus heteromorphus CBS 117.55]|uniref:BZIP domain-containing protein n=1 Tax=Aspergillus heteromorphus CBS 117.55 TaxID=1448321 RepID=A0A317WHQ6_9EURO|nr:uncharacterized protein BO70DRAFT_217892 [Aspergillus heteromorphus CBS 117.55]PWY85913.1 hypothetical protein BO70DRAFT_217892 [Aspergillus heteromorphus CBS 117.55]